jgi:hypothetical protein
MGLRGHHMQARVVLFTATVLASTLVPEALGQAPRAFPGLLLMH